MKIRSFTFFTTNLKRKIHGISPDSIKFHRIPSSFGLRSNASPVPPGFTSSKLAVARAPGGATGAGASAASVSAWVFRVKIG